jgi:hypothetical protein
VIRRALVVLAAAAAASLAACQKPVEAPTEKGVCYQVLFQKDGSVKFNKIAENQPAIEYCAARLEELRIRFLRMGGTRHEIVGAYQGKFLFVDPGGVSIADRLDGGRFQALTRTGDGRLAVPGYVARQNGQPVQ